MALLCLELCLFYGFHTCVEHVFPVNTLFCRQNVSSDVLHTSSAVESDAILWCSFTGEAVVR